MVQALTAELRHQPHPAQGTNEEAPFFEEGLNGHWSLYGWTCFTWELLASR